MTSDVRLIHLGARPRTQAWIMSLSCGVLILSWLVLNRSAGQWFLQALPKVSVLHGFVLVGVGSVLLFFLHRYQEQYQAHLQTFWQPEMRPLPLGLILGCGTFSLICQWFVTLEQIPALLFLLGSYGLIGLWLQPNLWNRGLPIAIALSCLIPFGIEFSTNLGFPARILTAEVVEHILSQLNIAALSSEDIIVLDTGIAQVELPCSGLKSLWIGTLFFLGATWLDRRQLGLRWLVVGTIHLGLLILANITRVLTLVIVAEVLQQPEIAEILHVPLGIIGFITACVMSYGLLRWVPLIPPGLSKKAGTKPKAFRVPLFVDAPGGSQQNSSALALQFWVLAVCLFGLAFLPPAPVVASDLPALNALEWPAPMQAEAIPLSPSEQTFFTQYPGVVPEKQRFQFKTLSGSVLFVASSTWRSHHAPELCLVGSGYELNHMESQPLTPEVMGRWLTLNDGTRSAAYWFQSAHSTTDAFTQRIWSEVTRQESAWTLVSVLFDQPHQPNEPEVQQFLATVHEQLADLTQTSPTLNSSSQLEEGLKPTVLTLEA
ncbi:MAG: exosortase O [Microcoleaceae cyanobacterium]